jgi:hypothetical protein
MKHFFLTLIALLGISYAFAQTHTVYFYDDALEPAIQSIVDQNDFVYEIGEYGYSQYTIADGTTLTFTMNDPTKIIYCIDEMTFEEIAMGFTFTINSSMPEEISFAADDPATSICIYVANACSIITNIKKNGMDMDEDYCQNGYLEITGAKEGDTFTFTASEDIDWGNGKISKTHTITIGVVSIVNGKPETVKVIGTDVWKDEDDNSDTNPGWLTIAYINRTIYGGMWNTICFPFAIDQTQMEKVFGENTVFKFEDATFSASDGLTVECSYATSMEANTPYLIRPNENIVSVQNNAVMRFEAVQVMNFNGGRVNSNNGVNFVGVVRPTALQANDKTKLFVGSGNKVYYPDEDMTLNAFRCYFEIPSGSLAPGRKPGSARFIIREKQAPTGVDNVTDNASETAAKKYMQNGSLVIENNGVRYNAQGLQLD